MNPAPQLFQHFKGGLYVAATGALNVTNNRATQKVIVYYRMLDGACYTRDADEFHEDVEFEGKKGPRFRAIVVPEDIITKGGHP